MNSRTSWDKNHPDINTLFNTASNRIQFADPLELVINCYGFNPFTQTLACLFRPKFLSGGGLRSDGRGLLEWGELPNQMFLADDDWDSPEFLSRYKDLFNSNYIAELLCRMVFLEPTSADLVNIDLPWEEPNLITPEILIHCTTARNAKIKPFEKWGKHDVLQIKKSSSWTHWCAT